MAGVGKILILLGAVLVVVGLVLVLAPRIPSVLLSLIVSGILWALGHFGKK
jgi:uncharacterized protein YqgC (DUF456 family)